jgi:hypothetical protein
MAAQTCYWDDAAADEDWNAAGNWETENEADRVPLADDRVIFDSRMVTAPTGGMLDSESGATANATIDLLHFKKGYTGGIGSATEPLCSQPDKIIIDGSGTYYILCGKDDQSTNATIPLVLINNKDATVYLYSNCNDGANLCEFTDVYVTAGTVYIAFYDPDTDDQGCYVKNLYLVPKNNSSSDVTVTMAKDAYDVLNSVATNVYMQNGTLLCDAMLGTVNMYGGTVYYGSEPSTGTAVTEADMDIATLRLSGGTFYWEPDDTGTPTITTAHLLGGTFDASGSTSNDIAKTITTTYLYKGATANVNNQRGNITMTNIYRLGGTLTMDEWAKIAITYNQA